MSLRCQVLPVVTAAPAVMAARSAMAARAGLLVAVWPVMQLRPAAVVVPVVLAGLAAHLRVMVVPVARVVMAGPGLTGLMLLRVRVPRVILVPLAVEAAPVVLAVMRWRSTGVAARAVWVVTPVMAVPVAMAVRV
jgi:hypothetical protein